MKDKGIEVGSRIHIKKYDSNEVYQTIQITKCCQELRDSLKAKISILIKNFLRATLDINLELKKLLQIYGIVLLNIFSLNEMMFNLKKNF